VRIGGAHQLRRDETLRQSWGKMWTLTGGLEDNEVFEAGRDAGSVR
jgi:hypothetical protein